MARQTKPIHDAYARCEIMRRTLNDMNARCVEVTEDLCGILWERWILVPSGQSLILWATPHAWDVFLPAHNGNDTDATIAAVKAAAQ